MAVSGNQDVEFAVTVAQEAGEILMSYFGGKLTRKIKTGPEDYATEADEAAEALILERLRERFPDDGVVTEESGSHGNPAAPHTWIVDPLDGTHHFANGSKDFAVMIARANRKEIELAVIWNPARKMLATAQKRKGVFLDGVQVILGVMSNEVPLSVERDNQKELRSIGYGVTNLGAAANTLSVLQGERRGFVSSNGYIWDFAPPALMLVEAGWVVTDFAGNPFEWSGTVGAYGKPGVIGAPVELHGQLLEVLRRK